MRCLLVEDEQPRIDAVLPELTALFGADGVTIALDRDSAITELKSKPFDVVVLDQRIPTAPGQLNPDVVHGRAVLEELLAFSPNTVVLYLTGLPMEDGYIDELLNSGNRVDIWGDGVPVPLIARFSKNDLTPFFERIRNVGPTIAATHAIEINTGGKNISVSETEAKLLRCFTRKQGGACLDIEPINDGMSGALVLRATVRDSNGHHRLRTVAKIGKSSAIDDETNRFGTEVQRLGVGAYAPLITPGPASSMGISAAFYRLADGYDHTLFKLVNSSDENAAKCVGALQVNLKPWSSTRVAKRIKVSTLVEMVIWEDRLAKLHGLLGGIDWQDFENWEINANFCASHGDLHGENVLVNSDHRPLILDYGAVEELPSAYDAITIELSPFFHPHGHREHLKWQKGDEDIDWFSRENFAAMTSVPRYVEAARSWAHSVAYSDREILACAYAYVLRQLQFSKGDHSLAISIIRGLVARRKSII